MANPVEFNNTYIGLPRDFYSPQRPTPVSNPRMIRCNTELARQLGWDLEWLASESSASVFAGNDMLSGAEPIATVYAGHQFGNWNPQLGDGRAILLGEVLDENQHLFDIQLKGAGRTPYSRGGDGRSPVGPVLREYVLSEFMAAMSIPTTRSLAAVTTGDSVYREVAESGAVLTRVASSHIRIGTFQYFSARGDIGSVEALASYCIRRHFPDALETERPMLAFLEAVIKKQAALIAQWQLLGFIHGVMNTDNMLICGETVDYGPCAMIDEFNHKKVYSSIDRGGRYAYCNQPGIAQWNLSWLARALIPLIDKDEDTALSLAQSALDTFADHYHSFYHTGFMSKLGLLESSDENRALIESLLDWMEAERIDFTLCFRALSDMLGDGHAEDSQSVSSLFEFPLAAQPWLVSWQKQLESEGRDRRKVQAEMRAQNPVFIPRNHLVQEVIDAAERDDNFQPFHQLVERLENPFEYDQAFHRYAIPPTPDQVVQRTFCGT